MKPSDNSSSRIISRNINAAKIQRDNNEEENPLFEQRLNNALDGLESYYYDHLKNRVSKSNALTIADYILAMKVETNPSTNYRRETIMSLKLISQFLDNKPFKEMTRDNILFFWTALESQNQKTQRTSGLELITIALLLYCDSSNGFISLILGLLKDKNQKS